MVFELLVALSLPLWLIGEQVTQFRRKRRRAAIVAARKRSRHAALESLLRGLDPHVRRADHPGTS